METAGVDTQQALEDSRLLLLDAERTLGEFLIDGQPHWGRFEIAMREAMSKVQMSAPSGLRAYGEMVGILWTAGDYTAAIRLEEFWNKLLHDGGFSLFCSYPIDIFASDFRVSGVDALLCDHTHLIPSGADEALENAINRAMDEHLGGRVHDVRARMKTNHRSSWALLPTGESMILWLRKNLPREADGIVSLAGRYYRTAAGF